MEPRLQSFPHHYLPKHLGNVAFPRSTYGILSWQLHPLDHLTNKYPHATLPSLHLLQLRVG